MEEAIGRPLETVVDTDDPALFSTLLEKANPFSTWDVQRDALASDPRYLALGSDSSRRAAFEEWKTHQKPEEKAEEMFLSLLRNKYRKGTVYALFKRANRTELAGIALPEKRKEQLFKEFAKT